MAEFKTLRGVEANLSASTTPLNDGSVYFCTDSKKVFIDYLDAAGNVRRDQVNSKYAEGLRYVKEGATLELSAEEIATLVSHADNTDIHVTKEDKETWNAKASTDVATESTNGLMSSGDKSRLDNRATFYNVTVDIPVSDEVVRDLSIPEMLVTDLPFVGVACSPENYTAERAEWEKVYDAVSKDGGITIYLTEPITVPIQMYCTVLRI